MAGCTILNDGETFTSPRYDAVHQYYKDINQCWLITAHRGQVSESRHLSDHHMYDMLSINYVEVFSRGLVVNNTAQN